MTGLDVVREWLAENRRPSRLPDERSSVVDDMLAYRARYQSPFLRDDRHRRGRYPGDEDPGWDDAVRRIEA